LSRILFAWELGGGYGHLAPFAPIARVLIARGHEVLIIARDVERANMVIGATAAKVLQAPLCIKTYNGLQDPPLNYSEILMRYGYLDGPLLAGLARAWRDLILATAPDVVMADHAPTALLAARGMRVGKLVTGAPFTVPPRAIPTPNMRFWVSVPGERLASSDASILATMNASRPQAVPPLNAVAELFDDTELLLGGIAELDPHGPRPSATYLGLYSGAFGTLAPTWPAGEGPRIFAYLVGEYRHLEAALAALASSGARCLVVATGAPAALVQRFQGGNLVFSSGMLDLGRTLDECDLCVCQGNFGTVNEALRRGRRMVVLPLDLEKFLTASALQKLNVACYVHPDAPNPDFAGAIRLALNDRSMAAAVQSFAGRHREPTVDTIVQRAADRIEALARNGGGRG